MSKTYLSLFVCFPLKTKSTLIVHKNSYFILSLKFIVCDYTVDLNSDILRNGTKIGSINLKQDSPSNKITLTIYDVNGNVITL